MFTFTTGTDADLWNLQFFSHARINVCLWFDIFIYLLFSSFLKLTVKINRPAAVKRDLRKYEQQRSRPDCASAQSGLNLRCSPTHYRDHVENTGLIVKILT